MRWKAVTREPFESMAVFIEQARRLLRETKKSVVDIALDLGYANPSQALEQMTGR